METGRAWALASDCKNKANCKDEWSLLLWLDHNSLGLPVVQHFHSSDILLADKLLVSSKAVSSHHYDEDRPWTDGVGYCAVWKRIQCESNEKLPRVFGSANEATDSVCRSHDRLITGPD